MISKYVPQTVTITYLRVKVKIRVRVRVSELYGLAEHALLVRVYQRDS